MEGTIFETHYEDYCRQISELDFLSRKETLDIKLSGNNAIIPFFAETYIVSKTGVADEFGNRPDYGICVILFKYLLQCSGAPAANKEWSTLKDFHKSSQFTNLNVFSSDAERPIIKIFSGRIGALLNASQKLGGKPADFSSFYDFAMEFIALPKIKILLLFNDSDGEFPASCSILFQRQAEEYLDPESLIMVGIAFTNRLKRLAI